MSDNLRVAIDPSPFPDVRQVRLARGFVTVLISTLVLLLVCVMVAPSAVSAGALSGSLPFA